MTRVSCRHCYILLHFDFEGGFEIAARDIHCVIIYILNARAVGELFFRLCLCDCKRLKSTYI